MQQHYFPNNKENQIKIFNETLKNKKDILQLGILDKKEKMFGIISLSNIDYINRNAHWSVLIGEKEYRNIIYVNDAINLILKHAFLC